ncbi:SPOR domain-containing protein [Echinicola jeungdonensis]|uniref:SPOR domain-containing protein n=1 Tax=Echinicola jeungdonensis TaxID=709343 RepID=A0ABV5J5F3_9BACT|nr:SPOR domain-containing protein [Echinicola jeungdonensis]MDN3670879.1 SPOR domain-containing protein [Echinicola jeungdonensis]
MTKKEREEDQSKKEKDKDFGLPEVEITPISKDEPKSAKPTPIPPSEKEEKPQPSPVSGEKEQVTSEDKQEKAADPKKEEDKKSNTAGILILVLLFIGIIGFAAWYLSRDVAPGNEMEVKSPVATSEDVPEEIEKTEPKITENIPQDPEPEMENEISMIEIDAKGESPRYFVVVGAFMDGDLARDYSDKLNEQGKNTFLIHPGYGSNLHKLAIGDFDNVEEASAMIQDEQPDFEETLWVLKY